MHFAHSTAGKRKASAAHPVHTLLDAGVRALRAWFAPATFSGVNDGPSAGLAPVQAVLAVLGEFLALPQAAAALRNDAGALDRILDEFLALAGAYGSFERALLALRQSVSDIRAGVRRGDGAAIAASLRARKRAEKELSRQAAVMRHASMLAPGNAVDGEVTGVAAASTASAFEAIFLRCTAMSLDLSTVVQTVSSKAWLPRMRVLPAAKKPMSLPDMATVVAALEMLEERIGELERGSEKVFRSLLQTRVSLLNIPTL